jgi:hypothetical protein
MLEGYGAAGEPVVAPVPLKGIVKKVGFERVDVALLLVPSWKV